MEELLADLYTNRFKTFIESGRVSGSISVWSREAYGIEPYKVIGSYVQAKYEGVEGKPVITKMPFEFFVDDKAWKPVAFKRSKAKCLFSAVAKKIRNQAACC